MTIILAPDTFLSSRYAKIAFAASAHCSDSNPAGGVYSTTQTLELYLRSLSPVMYSRGNALPPYIFWGMRFPHMMSGQHSTR